MSTATLPPCITHALGEDQFMVEAALKAGFVTLEHLDPACVAHRNALYNTLDSRGQDRDEAATHAEALIPHIPRPWLERWEPYYLWRVNHHPAVAAFLADAIRQQSWTAPLWKDLPKDKASGFPDLPCGLHGNLAQAIQDALIEKLEAHPHVEPIERALADRWFSPSIALRLQALLPIAQQNLLAAQEASKAQCEAQAKLAKRESRRAARERQKHQDPLSLAIASGQAHLVNRFALERLDPGRLATLLSDWLTAPAEVQACLLRVPNLTPEVYVQALTAWTSLPTERPKLPGPIPPHLLTGLPGEALATLLHHDLRHRDGVVLQPPVTPDILDSLVLAVAIAIPDMAASLRQGYALRWWNDHLHTLLPTPTPDLPTDPEARWVLSVTKLYAHDDPIKVRRALIIHHLFEGWSPDRQAPMAKPIAQWMGTLPYIA